MSRPSHDDFAEWHKQSATRSTETEQMCNILRSSYVNIKRRIKVEKRTNGNNDDPGMYRRLQVLLGQSRSPLYLR